MEYTQIKEWLDKRVDSILEQKASKDFNNQIKTDVREDVLVYTGIDIIANAIGAELKEEYLDEVTYNYKYSFVYRGIEFCGYENQRLAGFGEEVQC